MDCFRAAIAIAPDFVDAHQNLAASYGMAGRHKDAYDEYKKALELRPDYPNALYGLIAAEKNLGRYDDALAHCGQYERLPGCDARELRAEIAALRGQRRDTPSARYTAFVPLLLEKGRKAGYIQSRECPHIPELLVCADDVCKRILDAMTVHLKENSSFNLLSAVLSWSAYAGMGAVYHWHTDWGRLSKTGVYQTLTAPRGVDEMDEYVLNAIGIPFGSSQQKALEQFLLGCQMELTSTVKSKAPSIADFMEWAKAMYLLGMVFEMNRLGMM